MKGFFYSICLGLFQVSFLFGNYEEALQQAQSTDKSLLVVFLQSEGCLWSEQFQKEILSNGAFLEEVKEEVICLPVEISEETVYLQEKFRVEESPSLLLLTSQEEVICKKNYLLSTPLESAQLIKEIVGRYRLIKKTVEGADFLSLKVEELKNLYAEARQFGFEKFQEALVQRGAEIAKEPFFLLEKYASLIEKGRKIKDLEVLDIREKILKSDPKNKQETQLRLAILDFQLLSRSPKKKQRFKALDPLFDYLEKFGEKDKENSWKVEMLIAQHYFRCHQFSLALEYAERAQASAPPEAREEIAKTVACFTVY